MTFRITRPVSGIACGLTYSKRIGSCCCYVIMFVVFAFSIVHDTRLNAEEVERTFAAELGPAHSAAMRAVRAKHPDDADVAFVFADSMMTLHPWKLWDLESGEPVALVPELQALLAEALEAAPNHPGLCHL